MTYLLLFIVAFALGALVTRRARSGKLRADNLVLTQQLDDYKAVSDALRLEIRLTHEALCESERLNATQVDVLRFQAQTIEAARAAAERFNAALDEALTEGRPWENQIAFRGE